MQPLKTMRISLRRGLAFSLAAALAIPSPAFALRQTGLEEQIDHQGNPTGPKADLVAALRVSPDRAATSVTVAPAAGLEEIEELLRDFPRLRAHAAFLSQHTDLAAHEANHAYYQELIPKILQERGVTIEFMREVLSTLDRLEGQVTKLWPSFPTPAFKSVVLVLDKSGFSAARGSNRRLTINFDPLGAFHPSRSPQWVHTLAHELGELIHGEYPEIKRLEERADRVGDGRKQHMLRVADVISRGYPGHSYISLPKAGADFFGTWGPKAFLGAGSSNAGDVVANAIALKLLATGTDLPILEGYRAHYAEDMKTLQDAMARDAGADPEMVFHYLRVITVYQPFRELLGESFQRDTMDQLERRLIDRLNEALKEERRVRGFFTDEESMWNEGTEPPSPLPGNMQEVLDKVLAYYEKIVGQLAGLEEGKRLWIDGPFPEDEVPRRLAFWGRKNFLEKNFRTVEYRVSIANSNRRAAFTLHGQTDVFQNQWEDQIKKELAEQLGDWNWQKGWFLLANGPEFTALRHPQFAAQGTQRIGPDETFQEGTGPQPMQGAAKPPAIEVVLEPFHPEQIREYLPLPMKFEQTDDYVWRLFVQYLALAVDEEADGIVLSMEGIEDIFFPSSEATNHARRGEFRKILLLLLAQRLQWGAMEAGGQWVLSAETRLNEKNQRELIISFKPGDSGDVAEAVPEEPDGFQRLAKENARTMVSATPHLLMESTFYTAEDGLVERNYGIGLIDRSGRILYFGPSGAWSTEQQRDLRDQRVFSFTVELITDPSDGGRRYLLVQNDDADLHTLFDRREGLGMPPDVQAILRASVERADDDAFGQGDLSGLEESIAQPAPAVAVLGRSAFQAVSGLEEAMSVMGRSDLQGRFILLPAEMPAGGLEELAGLMIPALSSGAERFILYGEDPVSHAFQRLLDATAVSYRFGNMEELARFTQAVLANIGDPARLKATVDDLLAAAGLEEAA